MSTSGGSKRRVDVVILTAITLEYQAALLVEAGALEGGRWEDQKGPNGLPVAFRTFHGKGGRPLRVAVAQAGDMGAVAATNALLRLVEVYRPRCVAMCGVCAGRPGKTNLGDVVAAERLFFHDTGKRLPESVQQDLETYILRKDWKVALEHFDFATRFRVAEWWTKRPVPYEWQENWVLAKLREGVEDPSSLPERGERCPQWEKVIEALWTSGHVEDGTLTLTDEGRKRIGRLLIKHGNRLPDTSPSSALLPFKVHVAPMGSGSQVVEDKEVWGTISEYMRKTLGLEMEAAALGALAHAQRDWKLDTLVMKGVMDFANHGRDDHFKEFAARASAECLMAFLRENLDVEVVPDTDDLLVSGSEENLPENPPPSALLNARYEVVPFHTRGREAVLAELDRWCDEAPPVAVRLLHAEGGVGKTRLAIEWTRRRRAMGWAAGFLPKEAPRDWFERLWALGQPVLVVLDYAESRSDLREVLLRVLRYSRQEGTGVLRRMRFLLLARNSGDWWQSLRQADTSLGAWLDATPPRELSPLAMKLAEREEVFHEAAERFATKRGRVYVKRASVSLSDEHFERVLYLHMAALVSVGGLPFEASMLMDVILDHEERFWDVRARQADVSFSLQRSLARQMVAAATLRGGFADSSATMAVASRFLGHSVSTDERELLLLLQRIYQRTDKDASMFLPALEPDLLGEGMVLRVASPKLQGERPPPDWIDRVFPPDEEAHVVRTGMEVLGRASATNRDVARPWIERILAGSLQSRALLALEAAKAIGFRTAFSVLGDVLADQLEAAGDVELASVLEDAGIPYPSISLCRVAEWTDRTLLQVLPVSEEEGVLARRAELLNNWGNSLSELGRYEEALVAAREALSLYSFLVQRNPDVFQPELARGFNNLGIRLYELERHEEALEATCEAVELYRSLVQSNPYAFQYEFAMSLQNLGVVLGQLGRHEQALDATLESVERYRTLVQHSPDSFQPDLAVVLNNLGTKLSNMGRHEDALEATCEAAELCRPLVKRNSNAFRSQCALVGILYNLSSRLSELGRDEEALEPMREAVELYRALAQHNPDAFRPTLAACFGILGIMLSEMDRYEEALDATCEAVELYRTLAERNPDTFRPTLALSLDDLGNWLSELGRDEEALEPMREAVELYRFLTSGYPDAFLPELAGTLGNLGLSLGELGRHEEALAAMEEAVEMLWPFFERLPAEFEHDTESILGDLRALHESLQRPLPLVLQERIATFERLTRS